VSEWIDVRERLPQLDKTVICSGFLKGYDEDIKVFPAILHSILGKYEWFPLLSQCSCGSYPDAMVFKWKEMGEPDDLH
jgi:hypothetical protein